MIPRCAIQVRRAAGSSENAMVHSARPRSIYNTPNEEMVRDHAKRGGFPANSVARVMSVIDPTTAE